ncbi:MAG TPA: dTMP kinase [Candidatus Saccharimonadales bacterium]|nr:dTMP kinase [Candidatus Saccharimonadales bacterium]
MPQPISGGLVVIFEGIDGSGKTTQLELAKMSLNKDGWQNIISSRNLGGTPVGEELRKVILSPLKRPSKTNLYISVAIQAALVEKIKTDRQEQSIILMDRGPISLAAYEIYGSKLSENFGMPYVENGMASIKPELLIIYQTDVVTSLERARKKRTPTDYFENQSIEYFKRVANGYEQLAKRYPEFTMIINANQSIESIHNQTMSAIYQALSRKIGS